MDALRATAATAAPIATSTATSATDTSATTTSGTAKAEEKSFATLFAEAKKDLKGGEKLTKVDGHEFARIKGGERDDQYVNLSGNGRSGETFERIWRDGRRFHVYGGAGADHVVVEVGKKAAAKTEATKTDAVKTTESNENSWVSDSTGATGAIGTSTTASGATTSGTIASSAGTAASATTGGTTARS
jgi:hypothetical protein